MKKSAEFFPSSLSDLPSFLLPLPSFSLPSPFPSLLRSLSLSSSLFPLIYARMFPQVSIPSAFDYCCQSDAPTALRANLPHAHRFLLLFFLSPPLSFLPFLPFPAFFLPFPLQTVDKETDFDAGHRTTCPISMTLRQAGPGDKLSKARPVGIWRERAISHVAFQFLPGLRLFSRTDADSHTAVQLQAKILCDFLFFQRRVIGEGRCIFHAGPFGLQFRLFYALSFKSAEPRLLLSNSLSTFSAPIL